MSNKLWQFFLQDDVDSFRRFLASASYAQSQKIGGYATPKVGSPAVGLGSSPNFAKNRKHTGASPGSSLPEKNFFHGPIYAVSREDVNAKDQYGRTLLHLAAASVRPSAIDFVNALLEIPFIDLYAQDMESGWTALHRALYAGNATVARALMARDIRGATEFSTPGAAHHPSGGLIKIKDREGNSPFDVYGATIMARDIKRSTNDAKMQSPLDMDDVSSTGSSAVNEDYTTAVKYHSGHHVALGADEAFTFGSNKNLTLGLGDEDDRQYPERISLQRPEHLLHRFYHERSREPHLEPDFQGEISTEDLPTLIKARPLVYQDIIMSKLHTAILTGDPESNLFLCGFGPGGRLGTGDQTTRFDFVCIESGAIAGKKIVVAALGQDHTVAISDDGEIFTWGSNKFGQLGYNLPRTNQRNDVPMQLTPRQIFNPFKKERILGAAASSIHTVVFSTSGLYTFGKNEGQLGLVDSDARSLEYQVVPRRVGVSLFSSPVTMVSAIDRATTCLLENHEVWVFTHYGYSRLAFPLDASSTFIRNSFRFTRYETAANQITKVASGGNTVCAMSSFGEVYSVAVNHRPDPSSGATSTTNPAKIRNALPQPARVWSIKKSHMAVRDFDVGQDGSIIICTASGSAWRKEKRTKIKDGQTNGTTTGESRSKDYKFVRIPGLSRVVAVRSNAFGAYAAAQRDTAVTKEQIVVEHQTLWDDLFSLLPFKGLARLAKNDHSGPVAAIEQTPFLTDISRIRSVVLASSDIESLANQFLQLENLNVESSLSLWISTTVSDVRIPVHEFILTGRSDVLRQALYKFRKNYYFSIPDVLSIEYDKDGQVQLQFQGVDFLSIMNFVFNLYTDSVLDVWHQVRFSPVNAFRYRQVRSEVMKIATHLNLPALERAVRVMAEPTRSMGTDMERALRDPAFFENGDIVIELDGGNVKVHQHLVCQRCPFFEGLFYGRAAGRWLSSRRELAAESSSPIHIDLKHIKSDVFAFVLRHMYADTGDELFNDVSTRDMDGFIDLVLDVMSVANELMMDRLAQICQKAVGSFVNTRNICHLLNDISPCSVTEFKDAALEYICLNLEVMLENRLLDDFEEDLLEELDRVCRENQETCQPLSRGRNSEEYVYEKYPELVALVERDRQRRIDSMRLRSRLHEDEQHDTRLREKATASPLARKGKSSRSRAMLEAPSPGLKPKKSSGELIFEMEDDQQMSPEPDTRNSKLSGDDPGDFFDSPSPSPRPLQGTSIDEPTSLGEPLITPFRGSENPASQSRISPRVPSYTPPVEAGSSKAPWGSLGTSTTKTGLKDILAETPEPRPSNIGPSLPIRRESGTGHNFPKLSQKERKKLQQQQLQEQLAAEQSTKQMPQSPWQTVNKTPKGPEDHVQPSERRQPTPSAKPTMTLRQTVAGNPTQTSHSPGLSTPAPPKRSVSHPMSMPNGSAKDSHPQPTAGIPTPSVPIIQSIRHTPRPQPPQSNFSSPPSGQLSLASILQQQQTEKDEIREAATAKHNLEDIQLEQEFQEWWDQESRRVMQQAEADAAAAAQQNSSHRGGSRRGREKAFSGRGKGRAKGGGGGGGIPPVGDHQPSNTTAPSTGENKKPHGPRADEGGRGGRHGGGNHPRGRGGGGGRGRGKERAQHA